MTEMSDSLETAVIPVAGFGTRFLPVTRAVPKPLLPVVDTPLVHRTVQEAVEAGFRHIVLVMSPGMEPIADYFSAKPALEAALEQSGKDDLLARQHAISRLAHVTVVVQHEARGLGHAVLLARDEVGDRPFAVFLPDEILWGEKSAIQQAIDVWRRVGGNVIGVVEVPDQAVPALGIVAGEPVSPLDKRAWRVTGMVEKPPLDEAPSNLAIVGPYILTPAIFDSIESTAPGAVGEIQITDAIAARISAEGVHACILHGTRIDAGTPAGMLAANIFEARRNGSLYERAMQILEDGEKARQ